MTQGLRERERERVRASEKERREKRGGGGYTYNTGSIPTVQHIMRRYRWISVEVETRETERGTKTRDQIRSKAGKEKIWIRYDASPRGVTERKLGWARSILPR